MSGAWACVCVCVSALVACLIFVITYDDDDDDDDACARVCQSVCVRARVASSTAVFLPGVPSFAVPRTFSVCMPVVIQRFLIVG